MIKVVSTPDIQGNCDVCLTSECGPEGVRVEGTPVAVGRRCVERLTKALPVKATPRKPAAVAA